MSAEVDRDIALQLEKLRAEIDRERQQAETLWRQRTNWAEQEKFWEHEAKMGRARNYIAVAAIAASLTAAIIGITARWLV